MDLPESTLDGALDGNLRAVLELASLAASVHNSQPWRFAWDGSTLSVFEDRSRALPVLDPSGRERVLSCGGAVLHARLALRELGYGCRAELLPDPGDEELLARISVTGRSPVGPEEHELAAAIPRRATDRDPFDNRSVPRAAREVLRAAAEQEGAWLRFVSEDGERDAVELQVLLSHADTSQRNDPEYLAELAAWRRDREAEGVPARALPSVPVELRGSSWAMRDFDAGRHDVATPTGAALDPPAAEHPAVLVIGTTGDDRLDWLKAGQALGRVLLRATADGLAAQPLTQVLEVPVLRGRMRHALGVVGHPQMLLRLGYGHVDPTSRRRAVDQVVTLTEPG